jgi:hypothetical protein
MLDMANSAYHLFLSYIGIKQPEVGKLGSLLYVIYFDITFLVMYYDIIYTNADMTNICYHCNKRLMPKQTQKHGLHAKCFSKLFNTTDDTDFVSISLNPGDEKTDIPIATSFFHGAFKKYSAMLAGQQFIMKVATDDYPQLPKTEYLSNQIAASLKLDLSPFYLIHFMGQIDCFVTANFMQKFTGSNLIHIYRFLDENAAFDVATLINVIKAKTGKISEIRKLIDIILFDALIGNHDRHSRNLALIQTKNRYLLAPCYDNPSYLAIEDEKLLGAQHEPRGRITTSQSEMPTMRDYVIELKALEYMQELVSFCSRVDMSNIKLLIDKSFISLRRKEALLKLIERRYEELQNAIH